MLHTEQHTDLHQAGTVAEPAVDTVADIAVRQAVDIAADTAALQAAGTAAERAAGIEAVPVAVRVAVRIAERPADIFSCSVQLPCVQTGDTDVPELQPVQQVLQGLIHLQEAVLQKMSQVQQVLPSEVLPEQAFRAVSSQASMRYHAHRSCRRTKTEDKGMQVLQRSA